jgi:N-acetylmuramoyl-L-alanine amidase
MEFVDTPSPNHGVRRDGAAVDMLVIHYTDTEDAAEAIDILTDPAAEVSAHYLIDEDGSIHRMVEETRRAWHAGLSSWRGRKDVNSCSIGIELVNPGLRYGYRPFPEVQMEALAELCRDIQTRHRIPGRNVVAHSDIAPDRKLDPGELFDWRWMAEQGIGLWPEERIGGRMEMLQAYGYAPKPGVIAAFQRHFRPEKVNGIADGQTLARLAGLMELVAGNPEGSH